MDELHVERNYRRITRELTPQDKFVEGPKAVKLLRGGLWGLLLQMRTIKLGESQAESEELAPEMCKLLDHYASIFQEPKGLPPTRVHDHKIPIIPDQGPVSVRLYRYPFYQKNEIEKQVASLL